MADKNARTYHVLKERTTAPVDEPLHGDYLYIASLEASSAEQAIRLAASESGPGSYVAVPDRSWTLIRVRVETPAPRVILDNGQHSVKAQQAEQTTLA